MYVGCGSSSHSILEVKSDFKKESRKLAVINFPVFFFCALGESQEGLRLFYQQRIYYCTMYSWISKSITQTIFSIKILT